MDSAFRTRDAHVDAAAANAERRLSSALQRDNAELRSGFRELAGSNVGFERGSLQCEQRKLRGAIAVGIGRA